jgi:hypothetical protein
MRYRRQAEDGDYRFGQGYRDFLTGVDAITQAILTRLKLLYGEWWEDQEDGLPLFEKIIGTFGPDGNKQTADILIRERILGTEGVSQISYFESNYVSATRKYTFYCQVETIYGQTEITSEEV